MEKSKKGAWKLQRSKKIDIKSCYIVRLIWGRAFGFNWWRQSPLEETAAAGLRLPMCGAPLLL